MSFRVPSIAALLAATLLIPTGGVAAEISQRTITVNGTGKVSVPPDMATIRTGVLTQAPTAGEALKNNSAAMQELMGTLTKMGVARKDIQTTSFNVSPLYQRDPRGRNQNNIEGYRVQNQVTVDVRDLEKLGALLDAVVQAGSNQLSGVQFGVADATEVMNTARALAIKDAKSRADTYAAAAGVRVLSVQSISEAGSVSPRPPMMGRAMAMDSAAVPVATGELDFQVSVQVVYTLAGGE